MAFLHNILRKSWRLFPEPFREHMRGFLPLVAIRNWLARRRWEGASHDEIYDKEYFQFVDRTTKQSAEIISDAIINEFHPSSVVDVGCGTGALLESLRSRGVQVKGLEYAQAALEVCQSRQLDVMKFDVASDELPEFGNTDLVISMEVGNQLHEASADRYIDMLCRIAPSQAGFDRGYQEGIRAGQDDRYNNRRNDYQNDSTYRDATAGYNSRYGDRNSYRNSFRDGYQRGYDEGYNSRNSGRTRNSGRNGLGSILGSILGLP